MLIDVRTKGSPAALASAIREQVHALIPHSILDEPPWGDREWIDRMAAARRGEGLFANWPKLAPQILKFARSAASVRGD